MQQNCRRQTHIHQAKAGDYVFLGAPASREGACRAARVDKELVHVLEALEAVGAAPAQHVDVEFVRLGEQQVGLVADEREALEEADADAAVGDHLRQRQRGGFDIQAALDDLEVRRNAAQVLVRRPVRQVAEAERLANLAGREELLELQSGRKRFGLC